MILFIDIDDCTPDPCLNGGSCVDGVNSNSCNCVAGYTDAICSTSKFVGRFCMMQINKIIYSLLGIGVLKAHSC